MWGKVNKTLPLWEEGATMTKEQTILNYMKSLDISRAEAEQLFEDDANDIITDEGEKLEEKAKSIPRKKEYVKKSNKPRVVKKDAEKMEIITTIFNLLVNNTDYPDLTIKNVQREITFGNYSLTLIKHRPPKK